MAQHVFPLTFVNLMGATVFKRIREIVPMMLVILSSSFVLWVHRAAEINQGRLFVICL